MLVAVGWFAAACSDGDRQLDSATTTAAANSAAEVDPTLTTTAPTTPAKTSTTTSSLGPTRSGDGPDGNNEPDAGTEADTNGESDAGGPPGVEMVGDFRLFAASAERIGLVWRNQDGAPLEQLEAARAEIEADGRVVDLILNAGLFKPDLSPAGLHIENGAELVPINLNAGSGNFHLMPNGVFYIDAAGAAVVESNAYAGSSVQPRLAVQSGPMLTIDGEIHPAFGKDSTSRFIRNGVGVDRDGAVVFMMSTRPVTLWEFASSFLVADVPNSLYLDGSLARMEEPEAGQAIAANTPFAAMLVVLDQP